MASSAANSEARPPRSMSAATPRISSVASTGAAPPLDTAIE
jgi:hypothetical protein